MAIVNDVLHTGAFVVSEANGYRSRGAQAFDSATDWAGAAIPVGQLYSVVADAAVPFDGAADCAGIVWEGVAANGVATVTTINRDAEVSLKDLTYDAGLTEADVIAALLPLGIVAR